MGAREADTLQMGGLFSDETVNPLLVVVASDVGGVRLAGWLESGSKGGRDFVAESVFAATSINIPC